jgi:hypothetical protein
LADNNAANLEEVMHFLASSTTTTITTRNNKKKESSSSSSWWFVRSRVRSVKTLNKVNWSLRPTHQEEH